MNPLLLMYLLLPEKTRREVDEAYATALYDAPQWVWYLVIAVEVAAAVGLLGLMLGWWG